ncbi:MAG: hypothetical protein Kow00124_28190 [Anaerolineae bacterium]
MPARDRPAHAPQRWGMVLLLAALTALTTLTAITGCVAQVPQTVRIGLVAPFEGRWREMGYDIIPAARLAVREWAARVGPGGVAVELVAYDDQGDPTLAVEQARRLAADPAVRVVIGHWRDETTRAALPVYAERGLPLVTFSAAEIDHSPGVYNLAPAEAALREAARRWAESQPEDWQIVDPWTDDVLQNARLLRERAGQANLIGGPGWGMGQFYALSAGLAEGTVFVTGAVLPSTDTLPAGVTVEGFTAGFTEGSLGAPPGLLSEAGYLAAWVAIERTLADMGIEAGQTPADGLAFDQTGRRINAPIALYRWQDGGPQPLTLLP